MSDNFLLSVIILAAGKGTRMKSDKAKVLHPVDGTPMVNFVVKTATTVAEDRVVVVIGHQAETVRSVVSASHSVRFAEQAEQLGTGHAVQCAIGQLDAEVTDVVILCGDVPLISEATLKDLVAGHCSGRRDLTVLAVRLDDPYGYGRIVTDDDQTVVGIVEEADATAAQKRINIVNSGIYCVERGFLEQALGQIAADNAQGEYYLTDIVGIGHHQGRRIGVVECPDANEVVGVNTLTDLAAAEQIHLQRHGKSA